MRASNCGLRICLGTPILTLANSCFMFNYAIKIPSLRGLLGRYFQAVRRKKQSPWRQMKSPAPNYLRIRLLQVMELARLLAYHFWYHQSRHWKGIRKPDGVLVQVSILACLARYSFLSCLCS